MRFRAAVTASGPERELRFRAPRLPQSQLTLAVPAGTTFFQALVRQGALTRAETPAGSPLVRYTAELGRADGPLLFRWHEVTPAPPAPAVRIREAYLWSLRPDGASLQAVLHYRVTQGEPTAVALEVPEALEVLGVEARSAEAGRPAPLLKPWHIENAGGKRQAAARLRRPYHCRRYGAASPGAAPAAPGAGHPSAPCSPWGRRRTLLPGVSDAGRGGAGGQLRRCAVPLSVPPAPWTRRPMPSCGSRRGKGVRRRLRSFTACSVSRAATPSSRSG